jgi:ferredoxin
VQIDAKSCQGHGRCYDLAASLFGEDDEGYGRVAGDAPCRRVTWAAGQVRGPTVLQFRVKDG